MNYRHITLRPRTVAIGADVEGVDLATLDDATFAEIRAALHRHLVLFFPAQKLTAETQMAFAARFGAMEVHEVFQPLDGHPEVSVLEHDRERPPISDSWHSDVTYREQPSLASILYARTIPTNGGDTLWRSAYAAYEALSAPLRELLDGLSCEHDFLQAYGNYLAQFDDGAERIARAREQTPPVIHPAVVVHPVTGRRLLYVNPTFTTRFNELERAESDALLRFLFEHMNRPEFHVRFKWREDDLAIWDNRATQHYATGDYYPEYRRMHRITVGGDRPAGITEQTPEALQSAG